MKYLVIISLSLLSLSGFSQKGKTKPLPKTDSVRSLMVMTLTKEDYAEMLQWIQSSCRHSGGECQDYTDFLKSNTRIIQDTTRKKTVK